ncbi:MAG: type II toxin-antitoxin system RelE/ParE family toxin [Desulfuromonadales bacterium]|nr:type II toxin-antitoxin system RelE/ParE family toxin [Desulfuromonadales bacterium]
MNVVWTEHALQSLVAIEDYIAMDDPAAAVSFIERLIRRTDILMEQPRVGRMVPEVPGRELRELIEGNYRIVYRLNETTVEILTVFEAHKSFRID